MTEVAENLTNGQGSSERTPATNSIDWEKIAQSHTPFQQYASRRSVVYGTKGGSGSSPGMTHSYLWLTGMVACSQPLAAEAGLEILRKGGNAGKYHPSSSDQVQTPSFTAAMLEKPMPLLRSLPR